MFTRNIIVAAALAALFSPLAQAQTSDPGSIRFGTTVYKSNNSGKMTPLKAGKGTFDVTVQLLEDPAGFPVHTETLSFTVGSDAPSSPATSDFRVPSKVLGRVDIVLGGDPSNPLPSDLMTKDIWYTTQVGVMKKGQLVFYDISPAQPLGLSGHSQGQEIAPGTVRTSALQLTTGAVSGMVLTSDADGNATWQPSDVVIGVISGTEILDESITADDLGPGSVGSDELATNSVDSDAIVNGTITSLDISINSISSAHIVSDSVTASEIASNAVGASEIASNAVGASEIAAGAVGASEIAADAVGSGAIAANAVGSSELAAGAVSTTALASNSVNASKIQDNSITLADIGPSAVGPTELADDAVRSSEILDFSLSGNDVSTNSGQVTHRDSTANTGLSASYYEFIVSSQLSGTANDNAVEIRAPGGAHPNYQLLEMQVSSNNVFRFDAQGNAFADGTWNSGGADYADLIRVSSGASTVEPGDVMVIDPHNARAVIQSWSARSTLVAGIYSTNPSLLGWGESDWEVNHPDAEILTMLGEESEAIALRREDMTALSDEIPLGLVGIVPCKVSAENGSIAPGDLLVTSYTPGHAMRDDAPRPGTIVGKALGSLTSGRGVIDVLVTLQ